jgi:hypothetical protein
MSAILMPPKNKPKTIGEKVKNQSSKSNKDKMDSIAAQITNKDVSITSQTTSHGTVDSVSTMSEPCCQQAVKNFIPVSTINDGMLTQLCLDLNQHVGDPTSLVAQFKAAWAGAMNAEVNMVCAYMMLSQAKQLITSIICRFMACRKLTLLCMMIL